MKFFRAVHSERASGIVPPMEVCAMLMLSSFLS
jgi:hypothetical protein